MKKKICVIVAIATLGLTTINIQASVDDVNSFLQEYQIEDDTFFIEEYCNEETGAKSLFIRTKLIFNDNGLADKSVALHDNESLMIEEMSKQEWFDYNKVFIFEMGSDTNVWSGLREYNILDGTCCSYLAGSATKTPWLINEKNDLDAKTINFLGNVAEELLYNNLDDYIESNPGGVDDSKIDIKESNGIAEISGNVKSSGKDYKFVVQFTYEIDENMNGTYNALYVGLNDVPVYGEYKEISNIKLN